MMPRLAALSIAEIIARTSLASGFADTPFCIRRRRVMTVRLRRERFVVWRARLAADRVLAMVEICERAGSRRAAPLSTALLNYALRPKCGCSFRFFLTV